MKHFKKILILILSILIFITIPDVLAGYTLPITPKINSASITPNYWSNPIAQINQIWFNLLWTVKIILEWLLIIFIVFIWAQMIYSMWSDEEALSKSKRQLWYSVVALLFINMPWTLYNAFNKGTHETLWNRIDKNAFSWWDQNLFFDTFNFWYTFWDQIVWFLEVTIFAIAVVMLIYQSIKLISSRWRDEVITETKNKITYTILALVFVWIIEAWKTFAFTFEVSKATNIFSEIANLALFFAAPIAFFFLTIAAYYYITSSGDEEKVKKAKSIVINTILATLILLASYTFLIDLAKL